MGLCQSGHGELHPFLVAMVGSIFEALHFMPLLLMGSISLSQPLVEMMLDAWLSS